MASYPLIGKKTVYIDDMVISPDYVQDEAGTITLTPGTTEVSSQSGTINVPIRGNEFRAEHYLSERPLPRYAVSGTVP